MPYPNIEEMHDLLHSKSKPLCSTNIWTNDINNEVNDPRPTIPIINIINIEHHNIEFVIQSCNESNQKSQFLKDGNFTKSSYSMMMEEFEYYSLLKQLNEEEIFMNRKQLYHDTSICLFLTKVLELEKLFH
jgi:hypothetical protein